MLSTATCPDAVPDCRLAKRDEEEGEKEKEKEEELTGQGGGEVEGGGADLSGMGIAGLPSDILVEVTARLAGESTTPLDDVVNLRRSCKVFRDATAAREVGRCMAVNREWRLHWWNKERFLSVLGECAATGNAEASYILGLEEICNRRGMESGFRHLHHAMKHGHAVAAYTIGMIMLRDADAYNLEGIEKAMGYLEECSAARAKSKIKIASVRTEAAAVMRKVTMHRWRTAVPAAPCADPRCGERETPDAWDEDAEQRRFCSRLCQWNHEYRKFVQKF